MATRTYPKTALSQKLKKEVNLAIDGICQDINSNGQDSVTLLLTREPTGAEDVILNTVVNDHIPSNLSYKIWDLVENAQNSDASPIDIDFDILPLAVHKEYDEGKEDVVTYYRGAVVNPDGSITYSDPILRTTWLWTFDPIGFPVYAGELVEWYLEDDSIGEAQKTVPHYFDGLHKIRKGKEHRETLIDDMQIPVSQMLVYSETVRRKTEEADPAYELTLLEIEAAIQIGRNFLGAQRDYFNDYIQHSSKQILTEVANASDPFLDWINPYAPTTTIRQFILGRFPA